MMQLSPGTHPQDSVLILELASDIWLVASCFRLRTVSLGFTHDRGAHCMCMYDECCRMQNNDLQVVAYL